MNLKDIRISMKIYPDKEVQQENQHWIDSQSRRIISLKVPNDVSQIQMNAIYEKMKEMDYAALDGYTFIKKVEFDDLLKEQKRLNEIFKIFLFVSKNGVIL